MDYGNGYVNVVDPYKVMFRVLVNDWLVTFYMYGNVVVHWFTVLLQRLYIVLFML